jgi:hypothetical protein
VTTTKDFLLPSPSYFVSCCAMLPLLPLLLLLLRLLLLLLLERKALACLLGDQCSTYPRGKDKEKRGVVNVLVFVLVVCTHIR